MKKKIIHIHSDAKFVHEIYNYQNKCFDNYLIFLGDVNRLSKTFADLLIILPVNSKDAFLKIKNLCETADIVILNNLEGVGIKLALSLNLKIKIIWRFYGWEIYSKEPKLIYSNKSLQTWKSYYEKLSITQKIKYSIYKLIYGKNTFKLAIDRIDYFMGVMDDEHTLLKSLGYNLPTFIQVPLTSFAPKELEFEKSNLIIFGNSRNRANNHLDVLEILNCINLPVDLEIKMFYSYGTTGSYSKVVKHEANNIAQIELLEDFLSKEEFDSIYQKAAALIFNGYRQMAMGNIFTALKMGVKVYLSEKNITFHWLIKNNIKVFSIEEQLKFDLETRNYFLTQEEKTTNAQSLSQLVKGKNIEEFNNKIFEISNQN